ncbi:MAG: ABC transporter ATP-binding protein [Proteobacteria bacterium]|nr:ABC transporter ATP-binding protein [Pseudomonadota bacterium]
MTAGTLYRRSLREHWPSYVAGVVALFSCSISEVLIPRFVQWSLDTIGHTDAQIPLWFARATPLLALKALIYGLLLALVIGLIGRVGWRQLLARQTHIAGRELKVRFWQVLRLLPLRTFHAYPLGDLMNRATGDWNASRAIHGFTVVATLDMIFFTVLSVVSMLSIDLGLTLYCLFIFPFLPYWILKLARKEHDLHIVAQEKLGDLSDAVAQALSTIRLQRATNTDELWQARLRTEARDYAEKRFAVVKTGWRIFPLGALPTLIAYGVLLVFGVQKISLGTLSVGQFVALLSYVLMLQGPLFDLGDIIAEWQRGFASLSRMVEIFNLQRLADVFSAKSLVPDLARHGATIEVHGLDFRFDAGERLILDDINLSIKSGERIGIAGPIGAGKTTLLSLLSGLLDGPEQRILIAGADIQPVARDWLAQHVAMVPQRAFLFAGTLRYNLQLEGEFSDERLWEVLDTVQLAADVRGFEGGLDTWVGEWGINLSGGQKQRLALARALLRVRTVLLLDDCLSAVDAVTEEAILRRLDRPLRGITVVWVAHRLSTLRLCDRVFRIEAGVLTPAVRPTFALEAPGHD